MAVIKQDDGLWLVDISDGKSSLTGKRIRHRKSNFLTKKEAELLVDTVFNTITRSVVEGDKVLISGFGTFKVNDRKARKGISPKTQEEMIIPASKTVTFKPSNRLKDAMN